MKLPSPKDDNCLLEFHCFGVHVRANGPIAVAAAVFLVTLVIWFHYS